MASHNQQQQQQQTLLLLPPLNLSTKGFLQHHHYHPLRHARHSKQDSKRRQLQKEMRGTFDDEGDNGSHKEEEEAEEGIHGLHLAFDSPSAQTLMVFVTYMTYLSVLCLFLCIPMLAAVPGGFFDEDGMFKFISIGFKQHSALSSFIWGMCSTFIGFTRLIAVVLYVRSRVRTVVYALLLTVTMGAGFVTVRYDEVVEMHFAAAAVWIASSLLFYGLVGAFNRSYSRVNGGIGLKIVWCLNVVTAALFLTFILLFNTSVRSRQYFMIAGMFEYATAFLILFMDFVLAFSVHTRFLGGADLLTDIFFGH